MTTTDPCPLTDADLLAWGVVLAYREQHEHDGITILMLPFPPCPSCGETVHEAVASWVREPFREEVTIDVQPCGHAYKATFADLERIHDHASEMLASLRLDDQVPGGKSRSTDDIVAEARARFGEPGYTRANERFVGEATEATEPATECADALAAELHRRWARLEELHQGMDRSEAAERRRMQLHGEVMGLRGALGIVLGGTVPGGNADRLGMEYHLAWMKRTGR
jgi:hypothetical protein